VKLRLTAPLCALALLALAAPASADKTVVSNTNDSGPGSLRQTVTDADFDDNIIVPAGVYNVTSGEIVTSVPLEIRGAGARRTIVRSDGGSRVFALSALGTVTLRGLTVKGGDSGSDDGGGIRAFTNVVLDGVALRGNRASAASPHSDGGGVFATGPTLTVRNSAVTGNVAYNGGGIWSDSVTSLTVVNTTISGNTAGTPDDNGFGGGIFTAGSTSLQNVTLSRNVDFGGSPGADLIDSGGLSAEFSSGVAARDSIIAGNTSYLDDGSAPGTPANPGITNNCTEDIVMSDAGHNLEDETDCKFTSSSSLQGRNPRLGVLADNGGQTDTMRLLAGSPAINRGAGCEPTDQRGLKRALGGRCDIGAYELVRCAGVVVNRIGTAGKDTLRGTAKADGLLALAGNDLLLGLGGNDGLCGGTGRDRLRGGKGRDKLLGGPGRDRLLGGPGRDRLRGGPGPDFQRQ
jgi:hypothetical protein